MINFVNIPDIDLAIIAFALLGIILLFNISSGMIPTCISLAGVASCFVGAQGFSIAYLVLPVVFRDFILVSCLIFTSASIKDFFFLSIPSAPKLNTFFSILGV